MKKWTFARPCVFAQLHCVVSASQQVLSWTLYVAICPRPPSRMMWARRVCTCCEPSSQRALSTLCCSRDNCLPWPRFRWRIGRLQTCCYRSSIRSVSNHLCAYYDFDFVGNAITVTTVDVSIFFMETQLFENILFRSAPENQPNIQPYVLITLSVSISMPVFHALCSRCLSAVPSP